LGTRAAGRRWTGMTAIEDRQRARKARRAVSARLRDYFATLTRRLSADAEELLRRVLERLPRRD
jgi:hypothetical protein